MAKPANRTAVRGGIYDSRILPDERALQQGLQPSRDRHVSSQLPQGHTFFRLADAGALRVARYPRTARK